MSDLDSIAKKQHKKNGDPRKGDEKQQKQQQRPTQPTVERQTSNDQYNRHTAYILWATLSPYYKYISVWHLLITIYYMQNCY